ncbi:hypothetical protein N1F89_10305 [Aquibium sp. A9E412]|uniref:hypothetical protein n=1 Tax=Aquibium sp. A9E412 TaxID=2976767 RepID=UPI0025B13E02|nr:hypothetical protein [Aquibium sp. A9E412]MDN2566614.1 hypothetical protein [Aquibium sp. A9E412]
MIRQPYSAAREAIVANAIREVANELRLVDVADYVAFIKLESMASIADIVESAAELYFMPGTLRLGHGGEAEVHWSGSPRIVLDLELRPSGATVYFTLALQDRHASVEVNYVAFDEPSDDPEANSALLERALFDARIRKSLPAAAE